MAFTNDTEFQDDFRKVGQDVTVGFAPAGSSTGAPDRASSENLEVAGKSDTLSDADDLEDDEDLEDEDDLDEDDDLEEDEEDEDLDDEDEEDDLEEDDDLDDDEEEDDDEDELEDDDPDAVKARLLDAEKTARAR